MLVTLIPQDIDETVKVDPKQRFSERICDQFVDRFHHMKNCMFPLLCTHKQTHTLPKRAEHEHINYVIDVSVAMQSQVRPSYKLVRIQRF